MDNNKNQLKPWVILAPHLVYPLRNGADLYVDGVAKGISYYSNCLLVGASTLNWYEEGKIVKSETFKNAPRSKISSALISIVTGKSYQESKFITKTFKKFIAALPIDSDQNIAYSFNSTAVVASVLKPSKGEKVIITHNFDIAFFKNLQKNLRNPLSKLTIWRTIRHTANFLEKSQTAFKFAHINEADLNDYALLYPKMKHVLLKAGVDAPDLQTIYSSRIRHFVDDEKIRLCFTGYLGGQQNLDALLHFSSKYWPIFKMRFGERLVFFAIGSNPGSAVAELCNNMGWVLLADLDDQNFKKAIATCHFSVLPFLFTSGTKFKLFTSLENGVPFLATHCIGVQVSDSPDSCFFSDDAEHWAAHIDQWQNKLLNEGTIESLHGFIEEHSWKKACGDFIKQGSSIQQ